MMKSARTLFWGAAIAAACGIAQPAWSAGYPERPVKVVVAFSPGGTTDSLTRSMTNILAQKLGQPFVVENRPGAAGNIGIELIKRAAPDGYTIGYGNINTLAVNRSLFNKLPYDVDQHLEPVAHLFNLYNVLIVPANAPDKSLQDLIDRARANPGKLSYGASGVGTTGHMGGELFKAMAKLDVYFIPYNGGPAAIQDLLGNRLDFIFVNSSEAVPLIQAGRVRALGVSSRHRLPLLPDVATLDEQGIAGYETVSWGGVVAPKGTPADVIEKLNASINAALREPSVVEGLAKLGAEPAQGSPADFKRLIDDETLKWRRIIEDAGIEKL